MTITTKLARVCAAAAVVFGVGVWTSAANAETETVTTETTSTGIAGTDHTEPDLIAPAPDGDHAEEAGEEHSEGGAARVVLPEVDELIFGTIAFAIFFLFVSRLAFPQLRKAQAAREEAVLGPMKAAEEARAAADAERDALKAQLADARAKAEEIIRGETTAAQQRAAEIISRAESEAAEIVSKARTDAEAEKGRVMAELQSEVTNLTLSAARQVLDRELSDPASQKALVEQFIAGARN